MRLIDETNQVAGTYRSVIEIANLRNIAIQYNITAAASDHIEIQLWGTVYSNAVDGIEDEWVEVTEFLTEKKIFEVEDESIHDISFIDSACTLAKLKVLYIVTTSAPNNTIKIGWNTDS